MQDLERVLKALANKRRLAILKFLGNRKRASVGDIAGQIKLSFRATSQHLTILKSVEIIEREQEGLVVWHMLHAPKHPLVAKVLELS